MYAWNVLNQGSCFLFNTPITLDCKPIVRSGLRPSDFLWTFQSKNWSRTLNKVCLMYVDLHAMINHTLVVRSSLRLGYHFYAYWMHWFATVYQMQKCVMSDEYTKDTMYAPYLEYFQPFLCSNAYALCFGQSFQLLSNGQPVKTKILRRVIKHVNNWWNV